jgi:hypothetical protein
MAPEDQVARNGTLFYSTTKTYTSGEMDVYDRAKTAVQVLALGFGQQKDESAAVVLCRIVEKALENGEPTRPGESGTPTPTPGSAASSTRSVAVVMWGVAVLSVVAVML